MRRFLLPLILVLSSCAGGAEISTNRPISNTTQPPGGLPSTPVPPPFGADGNRIAPWSGSFGSEATMILQLRDAPVIRIDLPTDGTLAIGYEDGELRILGPASDGSAVASVTSPTGIVYTKSAAGVNVLAPLPDQAPYGRPGVLATGEVAYVTEGGDVVVWDGTELQRAAVDALRDGDVLVDEQDRLLVLTGPSDRYPHSILGDADEATGFVVLATPDLDVVGGGEVGERDVIEGRRAIWADLDGDGAREVLVTVSAPGFGARLVALEEDGTVLGEGAPIGRSNRWRHQIAFGGFSVAPSVVEVITPHLGGIVSFASIGTSLDPMATAGEFTSHRIGARELDMAVAIDIDDDGFLELVLPAQDRESLVGIGLEDDQATVEWRVDLPDPITSNVAAGTRRGVPTIAVGTRDGQVFTWQPAG